MARIRSIKPEFPQSESMGRVSREARLCFMLLWTVLDDAGRARGSSRMLASLLYPYDDDAPKKIDGWITELERERCVIRYKVDGDSYIAATNWLKHQKIDRPSASRLPPPPDKPERNDTSHREPSRALAPDLGPRTKDLGSRTKDLGDGSGPEGARSAGADTGAAVAIYHEETTNQGWPKVEKLTKRRAAALVARLRDCGGLQGWRAALQRATESDFLTGRIQRSNGHQNWTPSFDFFLQESSFTKLREGAYDNRAGPPDRHKTMMAELLAEFPK